MLAIEVELLAGKYVATRYNDRDRVEWPPHPARLFSAAVAAWADADEPSAAERHALTTWEALGPPQITCSWGDGEWSERSNVTHYVPVNDAQVVARDTSETYRRLRRAIDVSKELDPGDSKALGKLNRDLAKLQKKATEDSLRSATTGNAPDDAIRVMPDNRTRQGRIYPTAIPVDEVVTYRWPDANLGTDDAQTLDDLLARIPRLGHSSSLVSVCASVQEHRKGDLPAPTLVPDQHGPVALRVAVDGQLEALEMAFQAHRGTEPRVLPAEVVSYGAARAAPPTLASSDFDEWHVLELDADRFSVRDTLMLTRAIRASLMSHSRVQPAPEILSGHRPSDGQKSGPSARSHVAIAATPFVGHRHADGSIKGLAIILPSSATAAERSIVRDAIGRWTDVQGAGSGSGGTLRLGRGGTVVLRRSPLGDRPPASNRPQHWMQASRQWASVTPVALDRHPGDIGHHDPEKRDAALAAAQATVTEACCHIGLPPPKQVTVMTDAPVRGSRSVRSFPPYAVQGGRLRRMLVHATLEFEEPVVGPILIGAARYFGYGLFIPLDQVNGDNRDR